MRIALVSCSKEKKSHSCVAHELYSASRLFSLSYRYSKRWADKVYILSALHGLVAEDEILAPYNKTLNDMSRSEQLTWASDVLNRLRTVCDTEKDEFLFLAGSTYGRDILPYLKQVYQPLQGLRMGERMARLSELLSELVLTQDNDHIEHRDDSLCLLLHKMFNEMPRYDWQSISDIPFSNGIYIVFEKKESYHGLDRIVRVGTHTSDGRLKLRLKDHFISENHNGSIFRKNIGKSILNACHDPFLTIWSIDTSKPNKSYLLNKEKNAETEARVSKYLRENFTFTVFEVKEKEKRLRFEEAIISTLHHTPDFIPSQKWAGKYSTESKIRDSGLWLKQGLDALPLSENEYKELIQICGFYSDALTNKNFSNSCSSIGKYNALENFLKNGKADEITLSFKQIEIILGFVLPKSATSYPAWWSGGSSHSHANAWLNAGYRAVHIAKNIKNRNMTFQKIH